MEYSVGWIKHTRTQKPFRNDITYMHVLYYHVMMHVRGVTTFRHSWPWNGESAGDFCMLELFAHVNILCWLSSIIHVTLEEYLSSISKLSGRLGSCSVLKHHRAISMVIKRKQDVVHAPSVPLVLLNIHTSEKSVTSPFSVSASQNKTQKLKSFCVSPH